MNNGNFKLYNASAGSGKTFTLIKEFLLLSLSSDYPNFKNILAVTFTNKAANEMKMKVLNNLKEIINDKTNSSDMKKILMEEIQIDENRLVKRAILLYDNILHNYSDLNISTIDAFAQKISRSFAKELNLPNQYKVLLDDEDLLDELIKRIDNKINKDDALLTKVLSQYIKYQVGEENSWHIESPIKSFVKKLLKEDAYKKGETSEISLIDENQYNEIEEYLVNKIDSLRKTIQEDVKFIEEIFSKIDTDSVNKNFLSLVNKIKKSIDIAPQYLNNKTITGVLYEGKKWFTGKKRPNISDADEVKLIDYYKDIIEKQKSYFFANIVRKNLYLYVLRGTLLTVIRQFMDDTNKVHISEFNKRISDIIGGCSVPFIYERIGEKYKHYFIDEFQDTSLLQWLNFLPLINNSLSEGKMNLLVGDAKQAIYRFRSGEVEQIIQLPKIYKNPGTEVSIECEENFRNQIFKNYLEVNHRSRKNIVRFNNSFYRKSREYIENKDYRSVYEDRMEQKYKDKKGSDGYVKVEIFDQKKLLEESKNNSTVGKKKTQKDVYREAVKESILRDINILVEKNFDYKDITILVRNNSDGSDIAAFLTSNGIRVISSDSILIKSSNKVQLIIAALRYMLNENNDVAKLTLSYYQELCKNENACVLSNSLDYNIDAEKLLELRNSAFSIYDLCSMIVKMYGFSVVEDVFLHYFMGVIHDWQNSENCGISAFLEYWDKKCNELCVKTASKENAVEIMTIHKSKGLAFEVVMYPYAITKVPERFHGGEKWLPIKDNLQDMNDIPYLEDFILPVNSSLVGTDLEHFYTEEYEKSVFDDFNIMYVATTRPKSAMYIYTENSDSKSNPCNFFVEYMSDTANHCYKEYSDKEEVTFREDFEFRKEELAFSEVYSLGEIAYEVKKEDEGIRELGLEEKTSVKTIDWQTKLKFDSDPTMFIAREDAKYKPNEWGNLVHDIMSKINTLEDMPNVFEQYVKEGAIDEERAKLLMDKFDKVVRLPEIREAFSKDAVVRNEMSILTKEGMLRPDRYVELPEKVVIIDYKTGPHDEKYYGKQQDYMRALLDMGVEKKIECHLLYIVEEPYSIPVYLDRLF